MRKLFYSILTIILLLSGCTTPQHDVDVPKTSLDGDWKSTTSNATLRFEKGKLDGNDGCNQFVGSYATQGDTLTISDKMMSTMMACPAMEQASAFKIALVNAKIYKNNTNTLELIGNKGETLIELKALSSTPEEGLYTIKYLNNGKQAVVSVKTPISMQLSSDGKMSGNTGCNQYTTSYTITGNQITIGFPATTRKLCSSELMEQEKLLVNVLPKSFKISRNGEKWEVRDSTGALQFSMIKE